jgi:membrane protein YqaA with SNARE-associated domain
VIEKIRVWTRTLYVKAQHWGKSDTCIRDLTILTAISCIVIPIPVEALLIAIITAAPRRWWRATLAIVLGSVIGALTWFLIGRALHEQAIYVVQFISPTDDWAATKQAINNEGTVFLAVAAFTPGLFRIGMVGAGAVGFNPFMFVVAVTIGRAIRFGLEAGLLRLFGERLRVFMEQYFDIVSLVMGTVAIVILLVIKLVK